MRPLDDKILRVDYNISPKLQTYVRLLQDYQAQNGYGVTVGPPGGAWGQFPASYHVQAAGALGTLVYTISPTLINEFSWGINRGKQGVDPLTDTSGNVATGGVKTYAQSLLPLKDVNGNALTLPRINQGSNYLNLLPAVNFGLPSGFSAQSSGQGVTAAPTFSLDSRWPFTGTDQLQTIQDNLTWVKGSHTLKAGFYYRAHGPQRERVLGLQCRRNLLLRIRPRQSAGHQLSLRQRHDGQHLCLRRRQHEAGEPRALHAGRVVPAGHL